MKENLCWLFNKEQTQTGLWLKGKALTSFVRDDSGCEADKVAVLISWMRKFVENINFSVILLDNAGYCFFTKIVTAISDFCQKCPMSGSYFHTCVWMSRDHLLETSAISEINICNGIQIHKHLICRWVLNHYGLNVCGFKSPQKHQYQCHLLSICQCQAWS